MNSPHAPPIHLDAAAVPTPTAVWHVRLLGGFEIDDGRHGLSRLRSRAAMALLARVALAPQRDHAREELAALLWPQADAATGRSRLRQTLSLLKAVLEPPGVAPVLLADRRVVRAAPGALWCDAVAFEQALRSGRHEAAAALYCGELLPGHYDEWIEDERARLAALHDRLGSAVALALSIPTPTPRPSPTPTANLASATARPRLPHYLTRLIGADVAGARLLAAVSAHRLVTVLGPGGCGKTRLAVEVAHHAIAARSRGEAAAFDGAIFVSLVEAVGRTDLLDRLLLGLRLGGSDDAAELLLQALGGRRMLVLLDNAEQLDDSAGGALAALIEHTPDTHWLLTSRRPLGLDGEQTVVLEGLPVPALDAALEEVALNPAVALFVDRARAHRADFHVSKALRESLVELVRWLEGLPLALELAASHVRTLGPADLLALLNQAQRERGTGVLGYLARRSVRSGADPRHASMLAVVEWSWRLLDAPQRGMLLALSLLPGGATRPLAAAIADELPLPAAQAQALLDTLVAHSVVRVQAGQDGQPRYAPFAPVREFALAQCDDAALRGLRQRLLAGLLGWATALPVTPPLPAVRDELPNVTVALEHAGAEGRADDAARLVMQLQSSWGEIALPGGVLQALDGLLHVPGLDDGLAAGCHALAATRCQEAGRPDDARRHVTQAMARLAACGAPEPAVRVMVLGRVARTRWRLDRDHVQTRELIAQALPLARAHDRPNSEASLLSLEAHLATVVDRDPLRGAELSQQALALWRRSGSRHLVNAGRFNVATNRMKAGQYAEVLDEFADLCREGRELQDWDLAAGALEARGTALLGLRRWADSLADLRESVRTAWEGMEAMALAYALWNLTPALARLRQGELATETMGAAETLWRQRFGAMDDGDLRDLKRMRRFARALLGPDAALAAWQRGAARPLAEVVHRVLAPLHG
ncbi:MAG: hypothetical protein Q8M01_05850 [Rubrivivax sp.]|nr:hypothetical protein [Rubrivivax sp.]